MTSKEIWQNRVTKELEGLAKPISSDVHILEQALDVEAETCTVRVRVVTDTLTASGVPLELLFDLGFRTNYPFNPPEIRIISGSEHVPRRLVEDGILNLALASNWTPSNVVKDILRNMGELIRQSADAPRQEQQAQAVVYELGNKLPLSAFPEQTFECYPDSSWSKVHLIVTPHQILEASTRLGSSDVFVTNAHSLQALAKIKFKRDKTLTLYYQSGIVRHYKMAQSAECVQCISKFMQQQGITGTVSGSRNLKTAEERLRQMDELEDLEPTEQIVQLFMDALRETTERLGAEGDARVQEVLERCHRYLGREDVTAVLERMSNKDKQFQMLDEEDDLGEVISTDLSDLEAMESELHNMIGNYNAELNALLNDASGETKQAQS